MRNESQNAEMSDNLYPRPMAPKILERQRFNNAFLAKLATFAHRPFYQNEILFFFNLY